MIFKDRIKKIPPIIKEGASDFWTLMKCFAFVYCVGNAFRNHVIGYAESRGASMHPTLNPEGDAVLYEYLSKYRGRLQRGDVVVAISPNEPKKIIIKRIIGMPGDILEIPYYDDGMKTKVVEVPKNYVFLHGDNSFNSRDSRHYGPIPMGLVIGRVFFRIHPFTQAGFIKDFRHPHIKIRNSNGAAVYSTYSDSADEEE